jgi:WD40 repeat protein
LEILVNNNSTKISNKTVIDYTTSFITDHTKDFKGRGWVFAKIDEWLADPAATRVFLLVGGPGTGKSAILARLTQFSLKLASADGCPRLAPCFLAFYHFCQAQLDATLSPQRFVEMLSMALALHYQPFAKALEKLKEGDTQITINATQTVTNAADGSLIRNVVIENLNVGNVPARVAFDKVVRRPLETLCQNGFQGQIVILVDSLDEARTWGEENILTLLAETLDDPRDLPPQVRFVLSSRFDDRVLQALDLFPSLDLSAAISPNKEDVVLYASIRLTKAHLDVNLCKKLASQLAMSSEGNFLYARYMLDDWLARPEKITEDYTLHMPAGLSDIYRTFLKRELARDDEEKWEDRYQPLLGLLAVARGEGLTSAILAGASRKKLREIKNALRACEQYLAGPQPDGPFRIYHQSFRDFLLENATYEVYPAEAHQSLVDFFTSEYSGKWSLCQDTYALRYTATHLISALEIVKLPTECRRLADLLVSLLTDYSFLENRVRRGWIYEVSSDINQALPHVSKDHPYFYVLDRLAELVRSDAQFIKDHPTAFFQSCWNRGWWFDTPQAAEFYEPPAGGWQPGQAPWDMHGEKLYILLERWREQRAKSGSTSCWLRALRPPPDPLGNAQLAVFLVGGDEFKSDLSADERWLVFGSSSDNTVKLYDLTGSGEEVASISFQHGQYIEDIAFSPRGDVIAVTLGDGTMHLLQTPQLMEIDPLPSSSSARSLAFSPNGRLLVSGHESGELIAWDMDSHQQIDNVKSHENVIPAVTFSNDGRELASWNGLTFGLAYITRWQLGSRFRHVETRRFGKPITNLAYSPDAKRLACAFYSEEIIVYSLDGEDVRKFQVGEGEHTECLVFTPDGKSLLAGAGDVYSAAYVYCWDFESGRLKWKLPGHNFLVENLIIFNNGKRLLTAGDNTIRLWDLERAASGLILNSVEPDIDHAVFDPTGVLIFTASEKFETVRARRVGDGKLMHAWDGHDGGVYSLAASTDGKRIACGCKSGMIRVWDVDNGAKPMTFKDHNQAVTVLAFSPDGRLLVTGSQDGTARLVDIEKRNQVSIPHQYGWITSVSFSSDGRLLIVGDTDRMIVWDVNTQKKISQEMPGNYYSTCFTDDSRYVVVEGVRELNAWEVATGKSVAIEDIHRQAFYKLKLRRPSSFTWESPGMEKNQQQTLQQRPELVLRRTETLKPVAWLSTPYAGILYHPLADIWGIRRGGHLYIYALEMA